MDFAFTEEQENLRQEVRKFMQEEMPDGWRAICESSGESYDSFNKEFSLKLANKGWLGMTWPKEYGGQGRTYIERMIVTEELLRHGAPSGSHFLGERQCGPALMRFGTPEQKEKLLAKTMTGEYQWCAMFSEPQAGSDLSNAQTRAEEVGDEFIVNGSKIWTSGAHCSSYGWLLAVTNPQAERKHHAFSEFVLDMKTPGITIRPLVDMSGEHHFNQVFLDDVHIPRSMLVGEKNRGFYQLMHQLDHERSGIERLMGNWPIFNGIVQYAKETVVNGQPLSANPVVRNRLADLRTEFEVGRLLAYRVTWMAMSGQPPNHESAMAKAFGTSFQQRLANAGMQILGMGGLLLPESKWAPLFGMVSKSYLRSPSYTIAGGTNEVLRGIIAMRGLGLPAR